MAGIAHAQETSSISSSASGFVRLWAATSGLLAREFRLTTPAWIAGGAMLVTAAPMLAVLNNRTIRAALESGPRC